MSLTIGSESIQVRQGSHSVRWEMLATKGRVYNGMLKSAVTASRGFRRIWSLQTPMMDMTDIEALEAELSGPGSVGVTGTLVNEAGTIQCHARAVRRSEYDSALQTASLSFELVESDPT